MRKAKQYGKTPEKYGKDKTTTNFRSTLMLIFENDLQF
jgi:hypothetical protein